MLKFSKNPQVADRQMRAIIFYLTAFGYIDGEFDKREKNFIRDYIRELVFEQIRQGRPDLEDNIRAELVNRFVQHFLEVFEEVDQHVQELLEEGVARGEAQDDFVNSKLKLRCYEIFRSFDAQSQEELLRSADALIEIDGQVDPAEARFRNEIKGLTQQRQDGRPKKGSIPIYERKKRGVRPSIVDVSGEIVLPPASEGDSFFDQFEHHYSRDPKTIQKQISADRALMDDVLHAWEEQRRVGTGKLAGHSNVADFAGRESFLDGHVYVLPPHAEETYDITVLGDLHGCYSNLKAALTQSRFFEKLIAYRQDPKQNPHPKIVLLGDYIDRGLFSLNGVLRTALQLFASAPDHVYILRGNHEYFIEHEGEVIGGVIPAEAINTLKPHAPEEVWHHYMKLFEHMPNMLLFGGTLLVHGGIPRDETIEKKFIDLSSLNDPEIRFQMMWSDPSEAEVIPRELQRQSARFPFGRRQAAAFLERIGCHTIVRGHEKVLEGFKQQYNDEDVRLMTVFSAGGQDNEDVPENSVYRRTVPMALTIERGPDHLRFTPWRIDYGHYNHPDRNGFRKRDAEITHTDR
ncbi:MAG: serine/threonine protein phosphatase [Myxococcales bacterium]|nr:serine/threonine protein phosphatase [Myxococcales bacterium]